MVQVYCNILFTRNLDAFCIEEYKMPYGEERVLGQIFIDVFGKTVKQKRLCQGISQRGLCRYVKEKTGYTICPSTVSRLEAGKASVSAYASIALVRALKIDMIAVYDECNRRYELLEGGENKTR